MGLNSVAHPPITYYLLFIYAHTGTLGVMAGLGSGAVWKARAVALN